jgi:hypothetical protein
VMAGIDIDPAAPGYKHSSIQLELTRFSGLFKVHI